MKAVEIDKNGGAKGNGRYAARSRAGNPAASKAKNTHGAAFMAQPVPAVPELIAGLIDSGAVNNTIKAYGD
jgi:hypothetical protein